MLCVHAVDTDAIPLSLEGGSLKGVGRGEERVRWTSFDLTREHWLFYFMVSSDTLFRVMKWKSDLIIAGLDMAPHLSSGFKHHGGVYSSRRLITAKTDVHKINKSFFCQGPMSVLYWDAGFEEHCHTARNSVAMLLHVINVEILLFKVPSNKDYYYSYNIFVIKWTLWI